VYSGGCRDACEGNFLPSNDDPVAVRMVSDKSLRFGASDDVVQVESRGYVGFMSLVAVFACASVTTVVSVAAFVAVYVYVEAVRKHNTPLLLSACLPLSQ